MNIELFYAGEYTKPEKLIQHLRHYMLYLAVGGFDYMYLYDSNNHQELNLQGTAVEKMPFLALIPPGITIRFSANEKRENWALLFLETSSELSPEKFPCTYMNHQLIPFLSVTQNQLFHLRKEFSEVIENFNSGSPAALEKAKLQMHGILAYLLPDPENQVDHNANAEALKKAIDADESFQYSLDELCRRSAPYSTLYMRKLFQAEYGMLPGEYRDKKRLNRILDLFAQTNKSLKMIADEVGMKHLPHLYAFLKRHRNLTPKQLMQQFRGSKAASYKEF